MDEFTPYAVHELIKAIYIGVPDKRSGIEYDLIRFIPLNGLIKQETELMSRAGLSRRAFTLDMRAG